VPLDFGVNVPSELDGIFAATVVDFAADAFASVSQAGLDGADAAVEAAGLLLFESLPHPMATSAIAASETTQAVTNNLRLFIDFSPPGVA
jgi:hypothetical protein